MAKRTFTRKAVTWALIATMLNPALMSPWAYGRDSDIFLGITSTLTTAEPNILVVLDTSDSMNNYEGWREYSGAYDSHIEYLWADPTYINTITTVAPDALLQNVGSSPNGYFTSYSGSCPSATNPQCPRDSGYFAGTTDTDRAAVKTAVLASANAAYTDAATSTTDPGARSIYRNYNDASWLYWLPAGTAQTDQRLWSFAFNRFQGGIRVSNFSSTNGTVTPVVRAGINFGDTRDLTLSSGVRTASSSLNRCTASLSQLMPSTVYAPTEFGRNSGVWMNQQWARWERWLNLENSRVAAYPGSHAQVNLGGTNYRVGATGDAYTGAAPGPTDTLANGVTWSSTAPPAITASRDINGGNVGNEGQPIRIQLDVPVAGTPDNTADSFAGWTSLKADLGGYVYQVAVAGNSGSTIGGTNATPTSGNVLNLARLQELRSVYGYTLLPTVTNATATEMERFSAWLGNRDAATAPPFGSTTGTPAYYNGRGTDRTVTSGTTTTSCTTPCGPDAGVTRFSNDPAGNDANNNSRPYFTRTGATYCVQTGAATGDCTTSGGTITPGACNQPGAGTYTTAAIRTAGSGTGCSWTGRQSKYIEGVGTVYYGGTCSGSCYGAGFVLGGAACSSGATSTNYCNPATSGSSAANGGGTNWIGTYTIDGVSYSNVTKNVQGQCADQGDTAVSCDTRIGNCVYNNAASTTALCPNRTVNSSPTGGTTTNYPLYNRINNENNLVHDCKADEPANNGAANAFMTNLKRNFNSSFNSLISTSSTTAAYTTNSANALDASAAPAIDLYSVNYLNWKYGPRGPNGHPIGRKTRLQIAKDALADLIAITDGVRFGLMTFNSLPNDITLRSSQGSQGGKIVYPIRRMGNGAADTDYANRAALTTVINNQIAKAATPLSESLYEAYLYFSGRAPRYGTSTAITANFGTAALPAVGGGNVTDGADASAVASGLYVSPIMQNPTAAAPYACQKNFVIMITDGGPELDTDATSQIAALRYDGAVSGRIATDTTVDVIQTDTTSKQFETGGLPYGPPSIGDTTRTDGGYVWLDELAYFMSRADMSPGVPHLATDTSSDQLLATQVVITYTIGFAGANSPVLENAAVKSTGAYYIAEDSAQLAAALTDALIQIRDWNPTVAAPTVPLSALNRSQNAADVYLAFFEPAPSQAWRGTLKRFRIGSGATECGAGKDICLIGKTVLSSGLKDIEKVDTDPLTGFTQVIVDPETVSFWNPLTVQDGSEPDKGGTGYQLINTAGYTPATRKLYTFLPAGATSADLTNTTNLFDEDNTRITKALLGNAGMTDNTRSTLINFIRGGSNGNAACTDATSTTACTQWRAWAHSDVQHSRPVIVTYDSTATLDTEVGGGVQRSTSQYLFYLTNDGLLHAVDAATGQEKWAYLVEEAIPRIADVMANTNGPSLDLADGSPVAWVDRGDNDGIVDGSERVWLFFGLRRGGRAYYALDITNINAPRFMWKITSDYHPVSNPSGTGKRCVGTSACSTSTEYNQLAQSWSTPIVGRVAATTGVSGARPNGNTDPVLLFGGGYDTQQDTYPLPVGTTSDNVGKALFVVEGSDGNLVKGFTNVGADFLNAAGIEWSIPSDLTAINTDLDAQGYLDRVLVGDVGGNLWRFDIGDISASNWKAKKLAVLSDPGVPNRKILFAPSLVPQVAPFPVEWHAVYVGTGDREHPLVPVSSDKIFMVVDFDVGLTATNGPAASFSAGDFLQLSTSTTTGVLPTALVTKRGWYRDLENGEKVTGSPFVFNQKLRFGTYNPNTISSECLPPGEGRLNEISALYGDLVDLNGDGTISARDRYYAGVSRGYFSPLQTVIIGSTVYSIAVAGGNITQTTSTTPPSGSGPLACQPGSQFWYCREQRIGVAQRIYWFMEPEQ
ncbi:PilC/PilY family type IV pilus protein [Luteitalea sp.]|uniref:PilC/PilY family type IV pilus protein n=1 Tax=Luteitalea sp. TaxID=2004800 RepID=UPI0025C1510C|nr:PilC/PilY family type IV pilus protein [Luteitalea sp.]